MISKNHGRYPLTVLLLTLLSALACGGIGLAYEYPLTRAYAVWAPDLLAQAAVVEREPNSAGASVVIPAMVFRYGWNEDFIIAQQHPNLDGFDEVDAGVTHWFILDVVTGEIHGPLTEEAYHRTRRSLGVPDDLDFTEMIRLDHNQ